MEYNNGGTSGWTIHSNVLIGYAGAGGSGSTAIMVRNAPQTKIYNNVIFGINGGHGWGNSIKVTHSTDVPISIGCEIKNNIIYSLSTGGSAINFEYANDAEGATVQGNIYYIPNRDNPFAYDGNHQTWQEWRAHGFDTDSDAKYGIDPEFVDTIGTIYQELNLKLSKVSPVLNGEIKVPFFSRDIERNYRLANTPWTKGAYEYVSYADEDVNQDGSVNVSDVQLVVNVILGTATNSRADVNGDGTTNVSDVQAVVNTVLG